MRNFEERNYIECKFLCLEDKDVVENGLIVGVVDLEEDLLFIDILLENILLN